MRSLSYTKSLRWAQEMREKARQREAWMEVAFWTNCVSGLQFECMGRFRWGVPICIDDREI